MSDMLRPCEKTYNFSGLILNPDEINAMASYGMHRWLLYVKRHGFNLTVDEIYQVAEAISDNWKRYYEST